MTQTQVRLLVVDDERNIRNNLRMVLEAEGYRADTASNGDDAVLRVKEAHYDIFLSISRCPKWMAWNYCGICALSDRGCQWSC